MEVLSEDEFYESLREESSYEGSYWERLEETMSYSSIGWGGPFFLFNYAQRNEGLSGIGRQALIDSKDYISKNQDAFRISGVLGENMRIVDDLLDGDGCESVEDRKKFLENYIHVVETGEKTEVEEVKEEKMAYGAGLLLHKTLREDEEVLESALGNLRNMAEAVETEDKSQEDGYVLYVDAAGREYGKLLMNSLGLLKDVEPEKEDLEFAGDYGFATQVADDKFDDDIDIETEKLNRIYFDSLDKLAEHSGIIPTVIPFAGQKAPSIYDVLLKINDQFIDR